MKSKLTLLLIILFTSCQYENEMELYQKEVDSSISDTSGLIAYFPFDNNLDDMSGNNNNLAAYGNIGYGEGCGDEQSVAIEFDGISSYLVASIGRHDTMAISLWLKALEDFTYTYPFRRPIIIDYSNKSIFSQIDGISGATKIHCGINNELKLNEDIKDIKGDWYHLVFCIYDEIKLYINGELLGALPIKNRFHYINDIIFFGRASSDDELDLTFLKGKLDEIRIYNRSLTETEVKALYYENVNESTGNEI